MGSLMPSGAGVRCSWVAVFKSILMLLSPTSFSKNLVSQMSRSAQRDQLRQRLLRLRCGLALGHVCNLDVLQHFLDALIHLAQRLADRAALGLIALAAHRDARRDK